MSNIKVTVTIMRLNKTILALTKTIHLWTKYLHTPFRGSVTRERGSRFTELCQLSRLHWLWYMYIRMEWLHCSSTFIWRQNSLILHTLVYFTSYLLEFIIKWDRSCYHLNDLGHSGYETTLRGELYRRWYSLSFLINKHYHCVVDCCYGIRY